MGLEEECQNQDGEQIWDWMESTKAKMGSRFGVQIWDQLESSWNTKPKLGWEHPEAQLWRCVQHPRLPLQAPPLSPGHVLYADIKMENGKSKGCGVVRFESPEVAERACRMMNGLQLRGREIDVRIDRNA